MAATPTTIRLNPQVLDGDLPCRACSDTGRALRSVTGNATTAAIRSIQKATGLDEAAARAMLEQAKSKVAANKPPKVKTAA